jgi:hypothetical protein
MTLHDILHPRHPVRVGTNPHNPFALEAIRSTDVFPCRHRFSTRPLRADVDMRQQASAEPLIIYISSTTDLMWDLLIWFCLQHLCVNQVIPQCHDINRASAQSDRNCVLMESPKGYCISFAHPLSILGRDGREGEGEWTLNLLFSGTISLLGGALDEKFPIRYRSAPAIPLSPPRTVIKMCQLV